MAIMAAVVIAVLASSLLMIYQITIEQQRHRLIETVTTQAQLIRSVARFDAQHSHDAAEGGAQAATLKQVFEAFDKLPTESKSFEFVLARKQGDQIAFIATRRAHGLSPSFTLPIDSTLAEPMRRALARESGSIIAQDYEGVEVLAAYEPVDILGLGIVAKLDLSEIQQPFMRAILIACLVALVYIALGTWLFHRVGSPLVRRLSESEAKYRELSEQLESANQGLEEQVAERTETLAIEHEMLSHSLQWNQAMMEAAADGIVTINQRGIIETFNASAEKMFGYEPDETIGCNIRCLMPAPHRQNHDRYLERYLITGDQHIIGTSREVEAVRKDGSLFPAEINVREVLLGDERRYIGIIRDLTERKRRQQALVEAESRSRLLLESVVEGIYGLDIEGRATFVNSAAASMLGYEVDELIGRQMHTLIHHTYPDGTPYPTESCPMYAAFTDGTVHVVDNEVLWRKDGSSFVIRYTSMPMYKEKELIGAVVTFTDITAEIEAGEALDKEHQFNQRLVRAIPSILIATDVERHITLWNTAAEKVFGIAAEQVIGRDVEECGVDCDWHEMARSVAECRKAGYSRLDNFRFSRSDGSDGFLGITFNPIIENGTMAGYLLLGSDVTERIRLQNQLQLAQKMEAVGELAAGIAHEINTPLQYVGDNVRFLKDSFHDMQALLEHYHKLKDQCEKEQFAPEMVELIQQADEEADIEFMMEEIPSAITQSLDGIEKAARIVGAMKEFSHPGQKEKGLADINRMLESTITVARNEWKYAAKMRTDYDEDLPMVKCLPELNQVFLNMIVNAAHAIEAKQAGDSNQIGEITVATSHHDREVWIEISDTGTGIPQAIQNKVFDPFFTTKEVGKGTGQGLAISHNIIVELHKGSLDIVSEEGKGTTFIIRIPIDQGDET